MNGYVCLWQGRRIELYSETMFTAKDAAVKQFQTATRKKVHPHQVSVILAEKDGKEVTHLPLF